MVLLRFERPVGSAWKRLRCAGPFPTTAVPQGLHLFKALPTRPVRYICFVKDQCRALLLGSEARVRPLQELIEKGLQLLL